MGVVEIRMLRSMSGYTRKDKFRNGYIWNKIGVASIEEKMTKTRL